MNLSESNSNLDQPKRSGSATTSTDSKKKLRSESKIRSYLLKWSINKNRQKPRNKKFWIREIFPIISSLWRLPWNERLWKSWYLSTWKTKTVRPKQIESRKLAQKWLILKWKNLTLKTNSIHLLFKRIYSLIQFQTA